MTARPHPRIADRTSSPAFAVALVLGACASVQFGAAVATHLIDGTSPTGAALLRVAIAGLALVAFTRPRPWRWDRAQWSAVVRLGVALGAMNGFFYAGLDRIPLGAAVTLEFLGPLLLAAALSRRALDLLWVALAMTGVALLGAGAFAGDITLDPVGVACVLAAGAFWAAYIPAGQAVGRLIPGSGGLAVAFLVASVALAPFGAPGVAGAAWTPQLAVFAFGTAMLSSLIPFLLEFAALRRLPQRVFGVLLVLEPVFAAAAGFLVLGQSLGPAGLAAIAAVVCASAGATWSVRGA